LRGAWQRAALGAAGMWWLLLAEPVLDRNLLVGTTATNAGDAFERIATSGALVLIPVWSLAALILPWLVRGRSLAVDVVGATTWAAGLAAATGAVAERAGLPEPRGLIAGAILAALFAVIGMRPRDTVNPRNERAADP
jgi:eukaryotic-like serine/threonine-protein kinase